jgi:hypothetical protein
MSDLTSTIDLTDSDILKVEQVIKVINDQQGRRTDMDGFRRQIIDRFHDAGFVVEVKCYTTNQRGLYAFDIEIRDRVEGEFDPERQVYEATNDILGLDGVNGGVIKSAPLLAQPKHSHGHSPKKSPMDHVGGKGKLWTPGSPN